MNKGVQYELNSKNEKKKSLTKILKTITLGAEANNIVTLNIEPS